MFLFHRRRTFLLFLAAAAASWQAIGRAEGFEEAQGNIQAEFYPARTYESEGLNQTDACCIPSAENCCPGRLNIRLSYTSPRGIARDFGYSTIAAFYAMQDSERAVNPYMDFRLHYLDIGRWAGNIGFGLQTEIPKYASTVRGYVFYDFRDSRYRTFGQFCLGAEWFGPSFDARLITYWPLQAKGHSHKRSYHYPGGYKAVRKRNAWTLQGFDLLASKMLQVYDCDLYVSAGPYYFSGHQHTKSAAGVKARVDSQIWNGLLLGAQASYDSHYDFRVFGQVSWLFPFGGSNCTPCSCILPIMREEIILLHKDCYWKTNYETH